MRPAARPQSEAHSSVPLAAISIHPQSGGLPSAHANLHGTDYYMWKHRIFPFFATIERGNPNARERICRVTLTVSTLAYGVRKADTLPLSIGYTQHAQTNLYIDSIHQPLGLALRRSDDTTFTPPHSVGLLFRIHNSTDEPIEVSAPHQKPGAHFVDGRDETRLIDRSTMTIPVSTPPKSVVVRLDSAGTYTLQYRGLNTGRTLRDTVTVLPYP